eukprot:4898550-Amphidinium_carterae.2
MAATALQHVGEHWKADRHAVLAAVKQNGSAQMSTAPRGNANREIVLTAKRDMTDTLHYATKSCRA